MVLKIMTKQRILVCPVCGETQNETSKCKACDNSLDSEGLLFSEAGIGPWWIRDCDHPFLPGMTYDHLAEMANIGTIERHTIIRGPTTRQFWKVARKVPGIAHLLGRCHSCGEHVEPQARMCEACDAHFLAYRDRNNLGIDAATPSEGKVEGMSSFLSDASILETQSTPLTLPRRSDVSSPSKEGAVGSPQFHSLERKIQQSSRTIRVLSVLLTISIIALIFTIVLS